MEPSDYLTTCPDEELVARFQRGEREAFGALVRRYQAELYSYLHRYLGDGTLAEDVFQNTFLQLYRKIDTYQAGRPVRPWLYTIATHQAIDALRRQGRHQAVSLDQVQTDRAGLELPLLLERLESQQPGPFDQVDDKERRQMVRASVDRLPPFLKEVILLAYYQGLKYRDIADILGIPVGTVKSRLHTALRKLYEAWTTAPAAPE